MLAGVDHGTARELSPKPVLQATHPLLRGLYAEAVMAAAQDGCCWMRLARVAFLVLNLLVVHWAMHVQKGHLQGMRHCSAC